MHLFVRPKMDETATIIRRYISEKILRANEYPFQDDASFLEKGIVDSLNLPLLVVFVEEQFGFRVNDADIVPRNFDSVSGLVSYVESMSPGIRHHSSK